MRKHLLAPMIFCAMSLAAQTLVPTSTIPALARGASCTAGMSCGVSVPTSDGFTLRRDIREVRVEFKVTDRKGRFHEVTREDVQILDDGREVRDITGFRRDSDLPVNLAILIDSSRSTEHELPVEKQMALGFVRRFLREGDRAMIAGFNTTLTADDGFTADVARLTSSVERITPGNLTAFHDAVYQMAMRFPKRTEATSARNVLVIVSDGNDTVSLRGFDEGFNELIDRNVTVFTVSVLDKKAAYPAADLKRLSTSTAGDSFYLYKEKELQKTFAAIDFEVRNYYVATYRAPDASAESFHRLKVEVAQHDLRAQTRVGYYASN